MLFASISRKTVWRHLKKSNALGSEWVQGWASCLASGRAGLSLQQSLPTPRRSETRIQRSAAAPSAEEGPGPKRTGPSHDPSLTGSSSRKRFDLQANPALFRAPSQPPRSSLTGILFLQSPLQTGSILVQGEGQSAQLPAEASDLLHEWQLHGGERRSQLQHRDPQMETSGHREFERARAPVRSRGSFRSIARTAPPPSSKTETSGRRELERARAPQRDRAGTFEVSRERARARIAEVQFLGRSAVPRPRRAGGGAGPVPRTGSRFPVGLLPAP